MRNHSSLSDIDQYALINIRANAGGMIGAYGLRHQDREDLVQELFLDYLARVGRFDPSRSDIRSFVSRIVRNHAKEIIRCRRDNPVLMNLVPLEGAGEGAEDGTEDDESSVSIGSHRCRHRRWSTVEAESQDLRIQVDAIVNQLPPRLASVARHLEYYSVAEVSRLIGVSRARVYQWVGEIRETFLEAGMAPTAGGVR